MPIFDQGYQHWQGPLSGHAWRWLTIARHGVRVQMKNRILRILVFLAWLPALVLVVFLALWGLVEQKNQTIFPLLQAILPAEIMRDPSAFRETMWTLGYSYFFKFEMYAIMLLVVIAGPGLISRDLRFNALPLYFARPLTRLDYFAGKLGVIGALVALVAVGPAVVAYVVGICFSLDVGVVKDTYPVLLGSAGYGLVITLSAGTLILAMSSLTRRSLYVGIAWAGLWIISGSVASIMTAIQQESIRRGIMEDEMTHWLEAHPHPPGVQMVGFSPVRRWQPDTQKRRLVGLEPGQEEAGERWHKAWSGAYDIAKIKVQLGQAEAAREDWRPLCSYVGNLNRMADLLLRTDAAWVAIGRALLGPAMAIGRGGGPGFEPLPDLTSIMERRFANQLVAQFPWWWSAGVLAGLLGISTWTLTRRVKSLDRLR
jgi:ABC-2 type transport system permease protein